jgi:threonine dehydratase
MVSLADIQQAQSLLKGVAARTPLLEWTPPNAERKLFLKLENLQPIGAFKLRGAYNKVASLADSERRRGVISYSSGNHAQGVAYAARSLGVKAIIVMPSNAPKNKFDATAALGGDRRRRPK